MIGSGAGGAVIAAHAARAGRRVVLLEEGPQVRGAQMNGRENAMSALLFKESGLQSTVDLGMTVLQGRVLGGTTLINNCICLRLDEPGIVPGDTLSRWHALGATIDPAGLARSYDAVERRLGVARIPEHLDHGNGRLLLDGWRRSRTAAARTRSSRGAGSARTSTTAAARACATGAALTTARRRRSRPT